MGISGKGSSIRFDSQCSASFGFEDREQIARLGEGQHFVFLGRRQVIVLIAHRQVMHPCLVAVTRAEFQDMTGNIRGKLSALIAKDSRKDRDFAFPRACVCRAHLRLIA
jgi:hypothetical protein